METRIGHLVVESPFGNAGGVVKTVEDVEAMAKAGVGWVEAGSYTLEPRRGNAWNEETGQYDKRVYCHNPDTGETFNSFGMPNKGMDEVARDMPEMVRTAHAFGKPLVVNVAPVSEAPVEESVELVRRAYEAGADAVLLNAGCPNVVTAGGGRKEILSHNPRRLYEVLEAIGSIAGTHALFPKVFVRTSPVDSQEQALQVVRAMEAANNVGAVFTPNTWPNHVPLAPDGTRILDVPGGAGGLSGPATKDAAREQTYWFALQSLFNVVSSGGIDNGYELHSRLYVPGQRVLGRAVHAAVAGAGTTLFYESEDWQESVDKLLREFAAASGSL